MDIPFGGVSWAENIHSPWGKDSRVDDADISNQGTMRSSEIRAPAWKLMNLCEPKTMILDDTSCALSHAPKYVIIGTEKSDPVWNRKVYILIIAKTAGDEEDLYERVGVGVLDESSICRNESAVLVRII